MAKYKCSLSGDFINFLDYLEQSVLNNGYTTDYKGGSDFTFGAVKCAFRVFERYGFMRDSTVCLSFTLLGEGQNLHLAAITSGAGPYNEYKREEHFLDFLEQTVEFYKSGE